MLLPEKFSVFYGDFNMPVCNWTCITMDGDWSLLHFQRGSGNKGIQWISLVYRGMEKMLTNRNVHFKLHKGGEKAHVYQYMRHIH